ncbi:DUF6682 family protein [Vibrio harveyi]|uniref:phage adaptor protein n=1 Tax=Vibrio harveyi TaxID=669 RepID=UPI0023801EBE|nr:DUF6682 family protein [Vibrio harveyi]
MANTPIKQMIDQAARLVVDKPMIRWDLAFWIDAYNAAVKAILAVRPDALTGTLTVTCVAGSTQSKPDNARYLIDVIRNENGKAITGPTDLKMFNDYRPDWRTQPEQSEASTYLYDERNLEHFYLYPPVTAGTKIEAVFALEPTSVAESDYTNNTPAQLNPMYDNAVIEWLVYRAFSEDSEITANNARAQTALNSFRMLLGDKTNGDNENYARNQEANKRMR